MYVCMLHTSDNQKFKKGKKKTGIMCQGYYYEILSH